MELVQLGRVTLNREKDAGHVKDVTFVAMSPFRNGTAMRLSHREDSWLTVD